MIFANERVLKDFTASLYRLFGKSGLQEKIAELEKKVDELAAKLGASEPKPGALAPKRRGRPPKNG